MTTKTLLDAVRADMRAKIGLTHSLHELSEAVSLASEAAAIVRKSLQHQDDYPREPDMDRAIQADLMTLDAATANLATRLADHRRAIETVLFGAINAQTNT